MDKPEDLPEDVEQAREDVSAPGPDAEAPDDGDADVGGADVGGADDGASPDPSLAEADDDDVVDQQEDEEDSAATTRSGPLEELSEDSEEIELDWYILKVQSNRENTICDALRRRVMVEGLEKYFGEIMVPTEDVAEFKSGKKRIVKRKLYPGYIVAHMAINDETWFIVRETPGIGDFTGSQGKPSPMLPHEVERIVKSAQPEDTDEPIKTAIPFKMDDRVRIKEGTFENFEGDVEGIDEAHGRVTVTINIFGRPTPVELEHWQIESV